MADGVVLGRVLLVSPTHAGAYRIPPGTVEKLGVPNQAVRRRVRLVEQRTGALIRETWSDAHTGAYLFDRIAAGTYVVYAIDHTGEYGGVIETDIVAEPMPEA